MRSEGPRGDSGAFVLRGNASRRMLLPALGGTRRTGGVTHGSSFVALDDHVAEIEKRTVATGIESDWTGVFSLYMNASLLANPAKGGWQALLDGDTLTMTGRCAAAIEALTVAIARGDDPSAIWVRAADVATAAGLVASAYERAAKKA